MLLKCWEEMKVCKSPIHCHVFREKNIYFVPPCGVCVLNLSVKINFETVSYKSTLVESTLFELLERELSNGS